MRLQQLFKSRKWFDQSQFVWHLPGRSNTSHLRNKKNVWPFQFSHVECHKYLKVKTGLASAIRESQVRSIDNRAKSCSVTWTQDYSTYNQFSVLLVASAIVPGNAAPDTTRARLFCTNWRLWMFFAEVWLNTQQRIAIYDQ